MRIAIFTESYAPVINGVASAVRWLAEALAPEHEVVVYAPRFPGFRDSGAAVVRLPSYRVPGHRSYPLALPWSPAHFREFIRRKFDVVHTHSPFMLGQVGRRWALRAGIPSVTTYHTLYVEYAHYGPWLPRPIVRVWLRYMFLSHSNACDQVAVPTEPIRDLLR